MIQMLARLTEDEPNYRTDDEANAQRQNSDDKGAKLQCSRPILLRKMLQCGDVDGIKPEVDDDCQNDDDDDRDLEDFVHQETDDQTDDERKDHYG